MRRIVLVMALLSGCSFVFVSGPPAHHEQMPYFSCTESRIAPVLDTIFAVLQGANFLLAATASDESWAENFNGDPPISRSASIPLYAAAALLGAGGAYYGFSRTGACRDAKEQALLRANRGYQPQTWPPQGPAAPPPQGPYAPPQQDPYAPPQQGPYAPPSGAPSGPPSATPSPSTTPYPPPPAQPPPAPPQPPPAPPNP